MTADPMNTVIGVYTKRGAKQSPSAASPKMAIGDGGDDGSGCSGGE